VAEGSIVLCQFGIRFPLFFHVSMGTRICNGGLVRRWATVLWHWMHTVRRWSAHGLCHSSSRKAGGQVVQVGRLNSRHSAARYDGAMSNRPCYRLHTLTWLATLIVGAAALWSQLGQNWHDEKVFSLRGLRDYCWPFRLFMSPPFRHWPESIYELINIGIVLCIVLGTAVTVERCLRRWSVRFQLRLSGLFALMAVVGCLLALWRMSPRLGEIWLPWSLPFAFSREGRWHTYFPHWEPQTEIGHWYIGPK
jgi:hypothetical protein